MSKKRRSRVRKVNTKNWGQRGASVPMAVTVEIPSGKCPFIMEDATESSVLQWIALLTDAKHEKITYKQSVYTYWARHSFDVNSQRENFTKVVKIIEEAVPERVRRVSDLMFPAAEFLGDF